MGTLCVLLGKNFLQVGISGKRVNKRELRLALDKGQNVVNELFLEAVAFLVYPLLRNLLLIVCNRGEGSSTIVQWYLPSMYSRSNATI